jgi:hypothetical protein
MKKTLAFWLTAAATLLAAVALVFYLTSGTTMPYVTVLNVCAVVFGAAYLALYGRHGQSGAFVYLISLAAVAAIGAVGFSLIVEVEALGYLVSGLRQWSDVQNWAYFAVCGLVAWLLLIVASFGKTTEKA